MNKIYNKKLNTFGTCLGILAILIVAFICSVFLAKEAQAETYGKVCGEAGCNYIYKTASGKDEKASTFVADDGIQESTSTESSNKTSEETTTKSTTKTSTTTEEKTLDETKSDESEEGSDLAANSFFGSNGLAPSGIIQWILFAILILIIVILIRKIFGSEDKYHSTPLKHA
jgi:cobalamin biosynthesis Mg chelatase CobN